MCGVFGFASTNGQPVNLETIARIAMVTERRGPHAFGLAWIDGRGRMKCYKQTGRISCHLGVLDMADDAQMLIGHCRYATQGSFDDNVNNHPHPSDGGWIVHNGQLLNYLDLIEQYGLHPISECDSEVLGQLIEQTEGTMLERCSAAVLTANPKADSRSLFKETRPLVMLGLWSRPNRLVAVRQGNPLHWSKTKRGYYLASLPDGMPGNVMKFRDNSVRMFETKGMFNAPL